MKALPIALLTSSMILVGCVGQVRARSNTADGAVWYFFHNPLDGVGAPAALGAAAEVGIDLAHPRPSSGLRYSAPKPPLANFGGSQISADKPYCVLG